VVFLLEFTLSLITVSAKQSMCWIWWCRSLM